MGKRKIVFRCLMVTTLLLSFVYSSAAVENGAYTNPGFLVTTQWLADHVDDANIRILDRSDIYPQDDIYSKGHIKNSIRMPTSAIKGLKLEIPEMLILKDLISYLEENGVSADNHIVVVGRSKKWPSITRVFWGLEILGHKNVSILDGGMEKWNAEKRPLTTDVPGFAKTTYHVNSLNRYPYMTGEELYGYLGLFDELNVKLVDTRMPAEFMGKEPSRKPAKETLGHIPGAIPLFFMQTVTGKDYLEFKTEEEIKKVFESNDITPDKQTIFMCVSGCFGSTLYFAARLVGYDMVSLYDGSWIDWTYKNYPVESATGMTTPAAEKKKEAPGYGGETKQAAPGYGN